MSTKHCWRFRLTLLEMALVLLASTTTSLAVDAWPTSSPEEQGMDSDRLADLFEAIQERDYNIHNLSIVRNGHLVVDAPIFPHARNNRHGIHSCTKSVVSALIGVAIENRYIEGVHVPVLDFFPTRTVSNLDTNKEAMTLEHLLTMTSGLDCQDSYLYDWRGLSEMQQSEDWTQYVLDLPMAAPPGQRFEYCNGASYLLSAIIQETTGMTTLAFARQHLFGPLGISDVEWPSSPQGIHIGWGRLQMRPHDMAKFGQLYKDSGAWNGRQIVPSAWVTESTRRHTPATMSDGYGYQWWVDGRNYFMALGFAGQFIFVVPDRDLIAVFTSGLSPSNFEGPERLLNQFIIPAAISSTAIPANRAGFERLTARIHSLAQPQPDPLSPLPAMASVVSGRNYRFDTNEVDFWNFSLSFKAGTDEALFDFSYGDRNLVGLSVGLDNMYRVTRAAGYQRAYKGEWLNDDTFFMTYQIVGHSENGTLRMEFIGDRVAVTYTARTTGRSTNLRAQAHP